MARVVIGMDPHKRSATIEVIDDREQILAQGRYGTDSAGYRTMLAAGRRFSDRVWAVEAVPQSAATSPSGWSPTAKRSWTCPPSCRRGCGYSTPGRGRKTDPVDAHSVAVAGLRSPGLRAVAADDATVVLRLLG
jgi:transposase